MAERLIKTIKHGITILAATPENVNCWDEHLDRVSRLLKVWLQERQWLK
jgi:hypothetical protein